MESRAFIAKSSGARPKGKWLGEPPPGVRHASSRRPPGTALRDRLESAAGVRLLQRTHRSVRPTSGGLVLEGFDLALRATVSLGDLQLVARKVGNLRRGRDHRVQAYAAADGRASAGDGSTK